MKKNTILLLILSVTFSAFSQTIVKRDPAIKKMVDEISSTYIEMYIRKLVSFDTRNNLSEQNDPNRGIGAAWNWIKSEMEKSIPASNGLYFL